MNWFYEESESVATHEFEVIYERYFVAVHAIAKRYHPLDADDVTADIFYKKILKAVEKGYFRKDENHIGLVITIAKRYCISIYNRNKVIKPVSLEEFNNSSGINLFENPSLSIDLMLDLKFALSQLSEKQHEVMKMTIEGYKDSEIAKVMESSVGAVRMLRKRARAELKKFL